jgi:hypothetical protein
MDAGRVRLPAVLLILLVICVACIAVAQLYILRSALGAAIVANADAPLPRPRRAAEVAWAVLPALALALVLWMTWKESRAAMAPPPALPAHTGHGEHSS